MLTDRHGPFSVSPAAPSQGEELAHVFLDMTGPDTLDSAAGLFYQSVIFFEWHMLLFHVKTGV